MTAILRQPRTLAWTTTALAPIGVALAVHLLGARVGLLAGALAGGLAIAFLSAHPAPAVLALVCLLPFQQLILATAYAIGAPAGLVRGAGAWKETLAAAIVVAALRSSRRRTDSLDRLALVFLAIVGVYLLVPQLGAQSAPLGARVLALRTNAVFVALFLAARRLSLDTRWRRRLVVAAVAVGAVSASVMLFEALASDTWNRLLVDHIGVQRYRAEIIGAAVNDPSDVRFYNAVAGRQIVRAGSLQLSPLTAGFYLLLPFSLALASASRRSDRPARYATAGLLAVGILLTFTRSAILGAVVVVCVFVTSRRTSTFRTRLVVATAVATVAFLPFGITATLGARATAAASSEDASTADHLAAFGEGVTTLVREPLGLGLGANPDTAARFRSRGVTSENSFLQVGNELGLPALLVFGAFLVLAISRTRTHPADHDALSDGAHGALVGLVVGSFFLHVWNDFTVSWTAWMFVGLATTIRVQGQGPSVPIANIPASANVDR
jgi:hypothetical protein